MRMKAFRAKLEGSADDALLGTGIAPLVAANHLLAQGKSVLLLNPDRDFFLEDSELPLDPLLQGLPDPKRLTRSSPEQALAELRPDFPGASYSAAAGMAADLARGLWRCAALGDLRDLHHRCLAGHHQHSGWHPEYPARLPERGQGPSA